LQDSRCGAARVCHDRGAGLSPCARNTIREAISRDTPSSQHAGHPVRRNCTRQRSWHLQRSPPAQSEDLPPEVWLAESLRSRAARPTPCVITHTPRLRRSSPATPRQPGIVAAKLPTRQHPRQPGNQGRAQHRLLIRLSPSEGRILQGVPRTALHALYLILKRMWHPQRIAL